MGAGNGYFRLPLVTLREIAEATEDADALAAWMILRRFAYGHKRELTAAGAKKIGGSLGIGWRRAGGLLRDLLAIRYGQRGEEAVLVPAGEWNAAHGHKVPEMKVNAPVYVMPDPGGMCAYLPDLLVPAGNGARCSLAGLCDLDAETALDALRLLVHAHAVTSCGDFIGADPMAFCRREWELQGSDGEFELGHIGQAGRRHYWLTREADADSGSWEAIEAATGGREEPHAERFWRALRELCRQGLLYRIAIVSDARDRLRYPLWIFGDSHRGRMESLGIVGLAPALHREATRAGCEEAEALAAMVVMEGDDSGLFIAASDTAAPPIIRTVYVPTLLAPTPDNVAGLDAVARLCGK